MPLYRVFVVVLLYSLLHVLTQVEVDLLPGACYLLGVSVAQHLLKAVVQGRPQKLKPEIATTCKIFINTNEKNIDLEGTTN